LEENNEKLEDKPIEDKEDLYQYTGTSWIYNFNKVVNIENILKDKKIKKRIMGNIRKKHKDLYKKHKVIVQMCDIVIVKQVDGDSGVKGEDDYQIQYTYELELKDKPKKKQNINI
jgi:hypothetical protein